MAVSLVTANDHSTYHPEWMKPEENIINALLQLLCFSLDKVMVSLIWKAVAGESADGNPSQVVSKVFQHRSTKNM